MTAALTHDRQTESYHDLEPMINDTVRHFLIRFGGDPHDVQSAAHFGFLKACETFRQGHNSTFKTWVRFKVYHEMLEQHRVAAKRRQRCQVIEFEQFVHIKESTPSFNRQALLDQCSKDAQAILCRIWSMPLDVALSIQERGGFSPHTCKMALLEFHIDLGWTKNRFNIAWNQIKEVLA